MNRKISAGFAWKSTKSAVFPIKAFCVNFTLHLIRVSLSKTLDTPAVMAYYTVV